MDDLIKDLDRLKSETEAVSVALKVDEKKAEIVSLEEEVQKPDIWQDETKARQTTTRLAHLKEEVKEVVSLSHEITEARELALMVEADELGMQEDLDQTRAQLQERLKRLKQKQLLNGPYDNGNAIISIHSGQGGTEACDWAEMLKRMYSRYFEIKGWKTELVEESLGEEAGIKAVTYLVSGAYVYGLLKREAGTHRLVRQSPFNADNLRQTSFALVEVLPQIEVQAGIVIKEEELEWQFFRSGGKGGQNVNKVNTAVRLKHKPSGLIIEAQTQRYQEQNRKIALSILTAKLWQRAEEKRLKELNAMKGTKMASWGSQIRSYVLHPYHLVKDVRTQVEVTDSEAVLNGNLDPFIDAEITLSD